MRQGEWKNAQSCTIPCLVFIAQGAAGSKPIDTASRKQPVISDHQPGTGRWEKETGGEKEKRKREKKRPRSHLLALLVASQEWGKH